MFMPSWNFHVFGHEFELNPGPFNIKEHVLITIMTAAGASASYAIDILLAQEVFYHQYFKLVAPPASLRQRPCRASPRPRPSSRLTARAR